MGTPYAVGNAVWEIACANSWMGTMWEPMGTVQKSSVSHRASAALSGNWERNWWEMICVLVMPWCLEQLETAFQIWPRSSTAWGAELTIALRGRLPSRASTTWHLSWALIVCLSGQVRKTWCPYCWLQGRIGTNGSGSRDPLDQSAKEGLGSQNKVGRK